MAEYRLGLDPVPGPADGLELKIGPADGPQLRPNRHFRSKPFMFC